MIAEPRVEARAKILRLLRSKEPDLKLAAHFYTGQYTWLNHVTGRADIIWHMQAIHLRNGEEGRLLFAPLPMLKLLDAHMESKGKASTVVKYFNKGLWYTEGYIAY